MDLTQYFIKEELEDFNQLKSNESKRLFIQYFLKRNFEHLVYVLGFRDIGQVHRDHFKSIAEPLGEFRRKLWLWARGHFKAVDEQELVPTPKGFVKHGELKAGDEVFSPEGNPIKVVGRSETFTDTSCYRITFNDGYSVVTSGDHRWKVGKTSRRRISMTKYKRHYRDWSIKTTEELFKHDHLPDNRYSVPLADSVEFPEASLLIPPYVLGAWLGDGTSSNGGFTCNDDEIVENIRDEGFQVKKYDRPFAHGIHKLSFKLRFYNLLNNKHIPEAYITASVRQRVELLQGLMDTDGTCDTRGTATFCNINIALAHQVFALANSLGLHAYIRQHKAKIKGEDYYFYQVSFQSYKGYPVFKLKRKLARCRDGERVFRSKYIISVEQVETIPTNCIKVDTEDGLYLIGERYTVTHNTSVINEAHAIYLMVNDPDLRLLIVSNTLDIAKTMLGNIKNQFLTNVDFRFFFKEYCPVPNKEGKVELGTTEQFTLKNRTKVLKEPTVMCAGVGTNLTGLHFDYMKIDDLVTKDSVSNESQILASKEYYSSLRQLFDNPTKPFEDVIGTTYHFSDLYQDLLKNLDFEKSVIPAREGGKADGKISFPERFSEKGLDDLLNDPTVGPYQFYPQYMLNPRNPKDAMFKDEWIDYYDKIPKGLTEYICVDPASTRKKKSDYTVIERWGIDHEGYHYLLEGVRDKLTAYQRIDKLFEVVKHAKNLKRVKYEVLGGRHGDLETINKRMRETGPRFLIEETKSSSSSKADRIEQRLVGPYHAGMIKFPRQLIYKSDFDGKAHDFVQDIILELLQFPFTSHDDALDCQSQMFEERLAFGAPPKKDTDTKWKVTPDMQLKKHIKKLSSIVHPKVKNVAIGV